MALHCSAAEIKAIYVSPDGDDRNPGSSLMEAVQTIERAFEQILKLEDQHEDIHVLLAKGIYALDEPIVIGEGHGRKGSITLKSLDPDAMAIISGGKRIKSPWVKVKPELWVTDIEAASITQVFIDNERATRSRWPNDYTVYQSVDVPNRTVKIGTSIPREFEQIQTAEIHTTGKWHFIRQKVEWFDSESNSVTTVNALGPECSSAKVSVHDRVYFENAMAFVDSENEWFYDDEAGKLYLQSSKDPNQREVVIPVIEELVRISGTPDEAVSNVTIENISFRYTAWNMPEVERKGIQAGVWGTTYDYEKGIESPDSKPVYYPPAALTFRHAMNGEVRSCEFTNLGEGAIAYEIDSHHHKVSKSRFHDVGSNGIQVARPDPAVGLSHPLFNPYKNKSDVPSHIEIADNTLVKIGTTDLGAVGIFVGEANHIHIHHNLIQNLPYSAISVGWPNRSMGQFYFHHNVVEWNIVHDCMRYLSDGAGIYVAGIQEGSKILNNWVYDIRGGIMLTNGIYLDEGSSRFEVAYNFVHDCGSAELKCHRNVWGTNDIHDNGNSSGKNVLHGRPDNPEIVRIADVAGSAPPDPGLYGPRD